MFEGDADDRHVHGADVLELFVAEGAALPLHPDLPRELSEGVLKHMPDCAAVYHAAASWAPTLISASLRYCKPQGRFYKVSELLPLFKETVDTSSISPAIRLQQSLHELTLVGLIQRVNRRPDLIERVLL